MYVIDSPESILRTGLHLFVRTFTIFLDVFLFLEVISDDSIY